MLFCGAVMARQPDSTSYEAPKPVAAAKSSSGPGRFYYGGALGFSFGDYTRISIAPLVGYRLTKMWSVGDKLIYEYIKDTRYDPDLTASNYGGSSSQGAGSDDRMVEGTPATRCGQNGSRKDKCA